MFVVHNKDVGIRAVVAWDHDNEENSELLEGTFRTISPALEQLGVLGSSQSRGLCG